MDISKLKLGFMKLEGFVKREEANLENFKIACVGLGQGGGKIAQEMARLGIFTLIFNTASSDLDDITAVPEENKILLPGFGGASKDISRGQKAIESNIPIVAKALKRKEIIDADYVFLCTALGGGTGNGGMPLVLTALHNLRQHKIYRDGQPTISVIAAIPGEWEKRGLKENAVAGIAKLNEAIKNKKVGSVLLVDNDVLYNDFYSKIKESEKYMEWEAYGNTTVASIFFETIVSTSLPAQRSFDKSEMIDVLSTPGYLCMGKKIVEKITDEKEIQQLIQDSFKNSSIFANEYNFERDAKIGGVIAIRPRNKIITNMMMVQVESEVNKVLENARITHSGLIDNNIWDNTHDKDNKERCIIYTLSVIETLPTRIQSLVDDITEARKKAEEAKKQRETEGEIDILDFTNLYNSQHNSQNEASNKKELSDTALFGIEEAAVSKDNNENEDEDIFQGWK